MVVGDVVGVVAVVVVVVVVSVVAAVVVVVVGSCFLAKQSSSSSVKLDFCVPKTTVEMKNANKTTLSAVINLLFTIHAATK